MAACCFWLVGVLLVGLVCAEHNGFPLRLGEQTMKFLIHFSQQHESFWLAELDSLLELNGVDATAVYDHDRAWAIVSKGHKVGSTVVG